MSTGIAIKKPVRVRLLRDMVLPFWPLFLVPVAFMISQYAAAHPDWAEMYIQKFNEFLASPVSRVLGVLPFSLAEMLLCVLVPGMLVTILVHLFRRDWLRALATPLAVLSLLYALFAGGWGIAYARHSYATTAGLSVSPSSVEELEALCLTLAQRANTLREQAQEDQEGVFAPSLDKDTVLRRVQYAYDAAARRYPWLAGQYGNPKPILLSEQISYLQISGIFIPFTLEANVNMNEVDMLLPATACHEAAHLRGWAREDEANYIAYVVCMQSGEGDFMYSGTMLGLIHGMNALAGADSEAYRRVHDLYSDGVLRDLAAQSAHWRQYDGTASEIQTQVNDAYLRVNRQEDGVRSYGRMVDLMLAEMRGRDA